MRRNYQLYILMLLPVAYILIFHYAPFYGIQLAFKDFNAKMGIWGSTWVGLDNFKKFFSNYMFKRVVSNTLSISLYQLFAGFPIPIILAIGLNCMKSERYKKIIQTTVYIPHFISAVVMVGIVMRLIQPPIGLIPKLFTQLGQTPINLLSKPQYFSSVYVWSGVWQNAGWGSIVYLAALASIDPMLHEAAVIDGASRVQRIIHIELPGIVPTAIMLFIMNCGSIMSIGFEKVLLMQNSLNLRASEVISTFSYKVGLAAAVADFSYASAIGLFNSVINFILIVSMNQLSKKLTKSSLW